MANVDKTNYWMSPYLQPQSPIAALKPVKKKKQVKAGRPAGSVNFPIDFFEHCTHSNDVEVKFDSQFILQLRNSFSFIDVLIGGSLAQSVERLTLDLRV